MWAADALFLCGSSASYFHLAISHRPTRGSISSYNIAGLISEVSEEVCHSNRQKYCSRRQPHSHLRPTPRGTPAYNLYFHKLDNGLHFCHCKYGSIFIQICAVGSKRRIFSATECVLAVWPFKVVQGHPRSIILVPIESAYATSY